MRVLIFFLFCLSFPISSALAGIVRVSTADSLKKEAFHGDGKCDEQEINAAIASLPPVGGTVELAEGTYDICAIEGTYGGITLDKSNIRLKGIGPGTYLRLADEQNTNVIRIIGKRVENIEISDMRIDGNRTHQSNCHGDPRYTGGRFECNGIKAYFRGPYIATEEEPDDMGPNGQYVRKIWVRNVQVEEAQGLNILLYGRFVYVFDSFVGDARSDSVELVGGPGQINRTTLLVDARSGCGLCTDAADGVQINENLVYVTGTGQPTSALFRVWQGSKYHTLNDNMVLIAPNDFPVKVTNFRGVQTVMDGNVFANMSPDSPPTMLRRGPYNYLSDTLGENIILKPTEKEYLNKQLLRQIDDVDNLEFFNSGTD